MSENAPVLVAVDGSEGSTAAVRYAAAEASRLGADLRILHVAPDYLPIAALYPMPLPFTPDEFHATGEAVLADALRVAQELMDPARITTRLAGGDRVFGILDAAGTARIVVLGNDRVPLLQRLAVGSTVGNVAARAQVPVVAVPSGWTPRSAFRRIVVAVKQYDAAPLGLIDAALERAEAQRSSLQIVHVWDFPEAYGDLVVGMMNFKEWAETVDHRLREDAADVLAKHPDVEVQVVARYGQPAKVLQELSADADLLVVARRAHAFPVGHFGSTGRALLSESRCPVEVLPVSEVAARDDEPASHSPAHA